MYQFDTVDLTSNSVTNSKKKRQSLANINGNQDLQIGNNAEQRHRTSLVSQEKEDQKRGSPEQTLFAEIKTKNSILGQTDAPPFLNG